jgi:NADH-quinone oxidoreductase subunit N
MIATATTFHGPHIDWAGLSPLLALLGGGLLCLILGLLRSRAVREICVPLVAIVAFGATIGLSAWRWNHPRALVSNAMVSNDFALAVTCICAAAGLITVLLAWRSLAAREAGQGEFYSLLLTSVAGMMVLVSSNDVVVLFVGLELLSIPLYALCATEMHRERSLESGLKYLIIGSVGSATLLYGLALLYGASGHTDFQGIAHALGDGGQGDDVMALTGIALVVAGLGFKAAIAPFQQWTPDVYEGAPTPVTAFMAVATKAAAFGILLRLFDVALIDAQLDWGPLLAALAAITIVVGNVGAIGQSSLKRILAWSSVAQAGYLLAGVVVSTRAGASAVVFYLIAYLVMNMAAFAVIVAREREGGRGDDISSVEGLGRTSPLLAWPLTVAMLSLAGIPATVGFIGKINLISASVDGDYAWLGVMIVVGSIISLAYYLRVVAAVWMRPAPGVTPTDTTPLEGGGATPALAGADPEADPRPAGWEVKVVAVACGIATIVFGIVPGPLYDVAQDAGRAFIGLF